MTSPNQDPAQDWTVENLENGENLENEKLENGEYFHILFNFIEDGCSLFMDKYDVSEHDEWTTSCVMIRRVSRNYSVIGTTQLKIFRFEIKRLNSNHLSIMKKLRNRFQITIRI